MAGAGRNKNILAKIALFFSAVVLLVTVFPKEGRFKYEFTKGKPWLHDDLYAPFDFAIIKYEEELKSEQEEVLRGLKPYFSLDTAVYGRQKEIFKADFREKWVARFGSSGAFPALKENTLSSALQLIDTLFSHGIIQVVPAIENKSNDFEITLLNRNVAKVVPLKQVFTIQQASDHILRNLHIFEPELREMVMTALTSNLSQNLFYDANKTNAEKDAALGRISPFHGMVQQGELVISKGALITDSQFRILSSLKTNYEAQLGTSRAFYAITGGQAILTSISILVLALFLFIYRKDIFANNKKIFLILLVISMMVLAASIVVRLNVSYFYLIPVCLVPVIIRVFFDTRLALFVHLITIFNTGFIVPNSFQFVFIQLMAGVVAIMSIVRLERRSQFIYTSFFVLCTYLMIYFGLILIQEGGLRGVDMGQVYKMAGNAAMLLFAYPIIYIIERVFGYITDVTLIELGNSNNKVLRELAEKAPGTFQHSLQVANLAEEASYAIGANSLLVRVGALYHDIGKMEAPMYFIENQVTGINPHDKLSYEESAEIIIKHVTYGITLAKKHKLPPEITDFIATHHGTRKVEYFYIKQKQENPEKSLDEKAFTYPGPIPNSKETALVMMADSVEAASRSIVNPDEKCISDLVDRIINKQLENNQFDDAGLTLQDIFRTKQIFRKKLLTIYHIRISYPEE
jgi:putative nucleotidyltransferase with HDIG domain